MDYSSAIIRKILNGFGYRYDTPSHQDLINEAEKDMAQYTPVCTHTDCCYSGDVRELEKYLREDKWQRRCPDCGHALTWKKRNRKTGKVWILK